MSVVHDAETTAQFTLPLLPYAANALEPTMSATTLELHHGKHHKAYIDKLNNLVANTPYARMTLENVVKNACRDQDAGAAKAKEIFNNAAQAWNHTFFWNSLSPPVSKPEGDLKDAIARDFGSFEEFSKKFVEAGVGQFGSGWVWLVRDTGKLVIEKCHDAMTPMAEGRVCILTIDVWEHAYYVDYQNRWPDFLKAVTEKLLNWDFAAKNFARPRLVT